MDLKGLLVLRLVVVLCMITLAYGIIIVNISHVNKCVGQSESLIDRGGITEYITSYCQCNVISNFSGLLVFIDNKTCQNKLDPNKTLIITPCTRGHGTKEHFNSGDFVFLIFKYFNNSDAQSSTPERFVKIYAVENNDVELFSVTCGLASASTTRTKTRPTSTINTVRSTTGNFRIYMRSDANNLKPSKGVTRKTSTIFSKTDTTNDLVDGLHTRPVIKNASNEDMADLHINSSKPDFPYMYVVGAGSILIVVALIVIVFVCLRNRNSARNTSKEDTRDKATKTIATIGVDNLDLSELPDNPLYANQENEDGGYSTCGNENQSSIEHLPDNPIYHSYHVNNDEKDSKSKKNKSVHFPSQGKMTSYRYTSENVSDNNAVYSQPNKLAKVSFANQIESTDGQNETVYAQVNKTMKQSTLSE